MKVKNVYWFTAMNTKMPIGIVTGIGKTGERKAYIGIGLGVNEKEDIKRITHRGGKFTLHDAVGIYNDLLPLIPKDSE